MRSWLTMLLFVAPACLLAATDAGATTKPGRSGTARPATAAETAKALTVGGDTFVDALPITTTPFTDSGTTLGYADDYDEPCGGGTPGTAPDVVYAFTPPASGDYEFSLCGSAYDTKLYVYDQNAVLLACNDDFDPDLTEGDLCYLCSRIAGFPCTAGETYFLVVDGFMAEAGAYALGVTASSHCEVTLPGNAIAENESPLAGDQGDAYNCGCWCAGASLIQAVTADGSGHAVMTLVEGWRGFGDRDGDWFSFAADGSGAVHLDFECEVASLVLVALTADCQASDYVTYNALPCTPLAIDTVVTPNADFIVAIRASEWSAPFGLTPAEYPAVLSVTGLSAGLPVESTTWGGLKGMYR